MERRAAGNSAQSQAEATTTKRSLNEDPSNYNPSRGNNEQRINARDRKEQMKANQFEQEVEFTM